MSKKVAILQPGYLPWMGFFEQLHRSDVFVIYDDVQYDKNGWRNRNRIKTPQGARWLTVPVKASTQLKINQVKIDNNQGWAKKHLQAIKTNYQKASFFNQYFPSIEKVLNQPWEYLVDLDLCLIKLLANFLGLEREILLSSDLAISGGKVDRLIKICQHLKAEFFYEGQAGREYIKSDDFMAVGIKIEFQNYKHPTYKQLYGDFISHLSVIDLLFNEGDNSLNIITQNSSIKNK